MYFVTYLSASCPSYGKKDVKVGIFYFQKAGFRNKSIVENNWAAEVLCAKEPVDCEPCMLSLCDCLPV